ncbi:hypothetical protein GIB67_019373, partial [Kingdonia uniflora]
VISAFAIIVSALLRIFAFYSDFSIEDEVDVGEKKIIKKARLEAGVVTENSKKIDGDGLEIKHLEETTEREVHRAIDLVGGKDGDISKSSRS